MQVLAACSFGGAGHLPPLLPLRAAAGWSVDDAPAKVNPRPAR